MPNSQFLTYARHPLVVRRAAPATRVLRQGTRQPRLARSRWPRDQHAVTTLNPVAQRQAHHLLALHASTRTRVQILNRRLRVLQVRHFEQPLPALVFSRIHLVLHQQRQALAHPR